MTYQEFHGNLNNSIGIGLKLKNPGKGDSTIKSVTENAITYIRGNSAISIKIDDIYNVYLLFKGKRCSTSDLKKYKSQVFDSKMKGHSCNCTFLFMVFKEMKLIKNIEGKGVKGEEFFVNFESDWGL